MTDDATTPDESDDPLDRLFASIDLHPFLTTPVGKGRGWMIEFVEFPEAAGVSHSFSQALIIATKELQHILDHPDRRYSGQFRIRTHPYLHSLLAKEADHRRISMNTLVNKFLMVGIHGLTAEAVDSIANRIGSDVKAGTQPTRR